MFKYSKSESSVRFAKQELPQPGNVGGVLVQSVAAKLDVPSGAAASEIRCEYSGEVTLDALLDDARKEGVPSIVPERIYLDEPSGTPKLPEEVSPTHQSSPYQFADYRDVGGRSAPDGKADNVCDTYSCTPVSSLPYPIRKALQIRYDALVKATLRHFEVK